MTKYDKTKSSTGLFQTYCWVNSKSPATLSPIIKPMKYIFSAPYIPSTPPLSGTTSKQDTTEGLDDGSFLPIKYFLNYGLYFF